MLANIQFEISVFPPAIYKTKTLILVKYTKLKMYLLLCMSVERDPSL
jgi:hypothetical protein